MRLTELKRKHLYTWADKQTEMSAKRARTSLSSPHCIECRRETGTDPVIATSDDRTGSTGKGRCCIWRSRVVQGNGGVVSGDRASYRETAVLYLAIACRTGKRRCCIWRSRVVQGNDGVVSGDRASYGKTTVLISTESVSIGKRTALNLVRTPAIAC